MLLMLQLVIIGSKDLVTMGKMKKNSFTIFTIKKINHLNQNYLISILDLSKFLNSNSIRIQKKYFLSVDYTLLKKNRIDYDIVMKLQRKSNLRNLVD